MTLFRSHGMDLILYFILRKEVSISEKTKLNWLLVGSIVFPKTLLLGYGL